MAGMDGECNDHGHMIDDYAFAANTSQQVQWEMVQQTAEFLLSRTRYRPRIAIILGTGLGGLAALLRDVDELPYACIPNFCPTTVKGHTGRLLFGQLGGKPVVCMQGRVHAYEGHSMWQTTFPVRVFHAVGVRVLLVTCASGSLRAELSTGDIVVIKDHINLPGLISLSPLYGLNDKRFGDRFLAMSTAYDAALRTLVHQVAAELGMKQFVHEGVYFGVAGPCYETIAETRMARCLGGDFIGMSTCAEVTVARHGAHPMRVVGLSLVTNSCADDYDAASVQVSAAEVNHDDVLAAAGRRADDLQRLVSALVARINVE